MTTRRRPVPKRPPTSSAACACRGVCAGPPPCVRCARALAKRAGRGVGNTTESRVAQSGSSSRSGAFFRTVFSSGARCLHTPALRNAFGFFLHYCYYYFCRFPTFPRSVSPLLFHTHTPSLPSVSLASRNLPFTVFYFKFFPPTPHRTCGRFFFFKFTQPNCAPTVDIRQRMVHARSTVWSRLDRLSFYVLNEISYTIFFHYWLIYILYRRVRLFFYLLVVNQTFSTRTAVVVGVDVWCRRRSFENYNDIYNILNYRRFPASFTPAVGKFLFRNLFQYFLFFLTRYRIEMTRRGGNVFSNTKLMSWYLRSW